MDGAAIRFQREHNERAWLAWHVAALPRTKKFPKLSDLQVKQNRRRKTWQESLAAVKAFHKAFNQGK